MRMNDDMRERQKKEKVGWKLNLFVRREDLCDGCISGAFDLEGQLKIKARKEASKENFILVTSKLCTNCIDRMRDAAYRIMNEAGYTTERQEEWMADAMGGT